MRAREKEEGRMLQGSFPGRVFFPGPPVAFSSAGSGSQDAAARKGGRSGYPIVCTLGNTTSGSGSSCARGLPGGWFFSAVVPRLPKTTRPRLSARFCFSPSPAFLVFFNRQAPGYGMTSGDGRRAEFQQKRIPPLYKKIYFSRCCSGQRVS